MTADTFVSDLTIELRVALWGGPDPLGIAGVKSILAEFVDFNTGKPEFISEDAEEEFRDCIDDAAENGDYLKAFVYQRVLRLLDAANG